ncbi:MAG: ATPase, T2SS/T4P/T4SS family [Eubacteriales bacterium]|nr:ATPase, T2SS/T4P/T4SS family [Eubacteriales bacterium]
MLTEWKTNSSSCPVSLRQLSEGVRYRMAQTAEALSDEQVLEIVENLVLSHSALGDLSPGKKKRWIRLIFCSLRRELEILHDYAEDPDVSEIMVNGIGGIFIERCGKIQRVPVFFENVEDLEKVIRRLAARVSREMNDLHPIVDARLQDGSRINAVNRSIALDGPVLTIRKFNRDRMTLEDLIRQKDISEEAADLLIRLVRSGYNMFVSGGTSSGKTTFLNVLSDFIPKEERVIVIEDSAELAIRNHENLVRMEARSANAQGRGAVTIRDLIKTSLRMRPDRIIVGEVRGGEVVDMLAAMSTGHEGSLSTGHANSPAGMIGRLETLFLTASGFPVEAVRSQIADAIDVFVHLKRTSDGRRRVWEIAEVEGCMESAVRLNKLFHHVPGKGLISTGNKLIHTEKLELYEQGERVDGLSNL